MDICGVHGRKVDTGRARAVNMLIGALQQVADGAEALAQRLRMYCMRRDAAVTGAAGLGVALVWGGSAAPEGERVVVHPGFIRADPPNAGRP